MEFVLNDVKHQSLSSLEVEERITKGLVNKEKNNKKSAILKIISKNTFTFFNILQTAICILLFSVGAYANTFYMLVVIGNFLIAISQEIKSKIQLDKLKLITESKVIVVRDNKEVEIDKEDIVIDDIIFLKSGIQVPCDSIILDGKVNVDESILTGESKEIVKTIGDKLLGGSFIVKGSSYIKVIQLSKDGFVGQISKHSKELKGFNSVIYKSLNTLVKCITIVLIPLALGTFFISFYQSSNIPLFGFDSKFSDAIVSTAGSVIGMIPAGLILLTSVGLTKGVIILSRHKTICSNIYVIESLARVTCLCLDKTGTLTTNNIKVTKVIFEDKDIHKLLTSFVNSFKDVNLTMKALQAYFNEAIDPNLNVSDVVDFDSVSKSSSVTINGSKYLLGAPDYLIDLSKNDEVRKIVSKYKKQGKRVVIFKESLSEKVLAYIVMEEELRKNVENTLKWFVQNGVKLKIISGDELETVQTIAKRVGIPNYHLGVSLKDKTDEEVRQLVSSNTIFTRVSPEQKLIIVEELERLGDYVGMTGDGVNDMLALKKAKCSISFGSANQSTKTIADIVLADDNFINLPNVVREGRRVINNIESSSSLFLSRTFNTILLTFFLMITLKPYIFEPRNLYLISLFGIGFPSLILTLQPNDKLVKGNFMSKIIYKAIPGALAMFFVSVVTYILYINNVYGVQSPDLYKGMITALVIGLLINSLTMIIYISWPLNKFQIGLVCSIIFLALFYLIVSHYALKENSMNIAGVDIGYLNYRLGLSILFVGILSTAFLVGVFMYADKYVLSENEVKYSKFYLTKTAKPRKEHLYNMQ